MIDDAESRSRARVSSVLDDKWTLEKLLGVGGMAAVYEARHRNGARAAVKVLHPGLARHKEVRERFLREGYAANRVEHVGAVKVLDDDVVHAGPDAGTAYIVMELLEGESLQDRLERGPPVDELEFLRIAEAVLDVLDAAHGRGVIHRDLKPENLFLVPAPPRVKVLDFGLARLLQGQALTSYGLALGTPSFMSPEQAAGRIDEIDGRTDLFALAATGFRVRTGRRIHEGENAVDLVRKMSTLPAPRVREVTADASRPFARVIDRGLEFRREDRYETAAAMRDDVRRAIAEIDGAAEPLTVPTGAILAPIAPVPDVSPASHAPTVALSPSEVEVTRPRDSSIPDASDDRVEDSDSIRIPKRRSPLVVLCLLVLFGGIGGKLWYNAQRRAPLPVEAAPAPAPSPSPPPSSAAAPSVVPSVATVAPPATALPSTSSTAPDPAAASARPRAAPVSAPSPAASGLHRVPPPRKTGPANVHRLKGKHAKGSRQ
ncbi:MAG TPA: serine/threonine-protein kinase [Polyangiaceae bacterium]|nr:serine/threonine-protein kinase [Polyangiaceae bacterium]